MECRYVHIIFIFVCCLLASTQCKLRKPLNGTMQSNRLQSGPVFLIDSRTILVTKFAYDNGRRKNALRIHNKWFKGIVRQEGNLTQYIDLMFTNQTYAHLTANLYLGQNLYLHVPEASALDVRHFSAIAIVNDKNATKTAVPIQPDDIIDLPERDLKYMYPDGRFVFVYPKCCPLDSYKEVNPPTDEFQCIRGIQDVRASRIERVPIHEESRGVKYRIAPLGVDEIDYEPFYSPLNCTLGAFDPSYEEDHLVLLSNLELMIRDIDRPQLGCMEYSLEEENVLKEYVYMCLNDFYEYKTSIHSSAAMVIHSIILMSVVILLKIATSSYMPYC